MGIIIPNMGMKSSLGEALFSKTQRRVLGLLFGNPGRSFYTNEIVRFVGTGIGAVQRELKSLTYAGLVTVSKIGNQKHYQANREAPIFEELHGIVVKTFGVAEHLRKALALVSDEIEFALVYGSIAKGTETAKSDIDLLVVSDTLAYAELMTCISPAEKTLGRSVNPTVYDRAQIKKRFKEKNAFLTRIMEQPKIWIKGSDDDIKKLRKPSKSRRAQG